MHELGQVADREWGQEPRGLQRIPREAWLLGQDEHLERRRVGQAGRDGRLLDQGGGGKQHTATGHVTRNRANHVRLVRRNASLSTTTRPCTPS